MILYHIYDIGTYNIYYFFHTERCILLNNINEIDSTILNKNESVVTLSSHMATNLFRMK